MRQRQQKTRVSQPGFQVIPPRLEWRRPPGRNLLLSRQLNMEILYKAISNRKAGLMESHCTIHKKYGHKSYCLSSQMECRQRQQKTPVSQPGFQVIPPRLERGTYCLEGSCSIQLSYGTIDYQNVVRREGDSNPRYDFSHACLANMWFQPLTHLSGTWPIALFFKGVQI